MTTSKGLSRRDFLRFSALASAGAVLPAFLDRTAAIAVGQQADGPALLKKGEPIPGFKDDHVLVVIQLGGGNDGLNTCVPFADDAYHRARPRLRVGADRVIKVDDYFGFHQRLDPLRPLWEQGKLAVINGVGYPNPNRSHFRSMEIWHTVSDAERYERDGWVGRYFDNCCQGQPEAVCAINVGPDLPQAFDGMKHGVGFQQPEQFRWQPGVGRDTDAAFREINHLARATGGDSTVDFLRHVTANITLSSDRVRTAARTMRRNAGSYTGGRLTPSLQTIAQLICANMPTRLYYTSISGFDTHANQPGQHENLLAQFAGNVAAFLADLAANGHADRVVVMAFSEFGRRVEDNASNGTDHGTAGPMFVIGNPVKGGAYGQYPSLTDLDRDRDLKHTVDFRGVYSSILAQWFNIDPVTVVRGKFDPLPLIK